MNRNLGRGARARRGSAWLAGAVLAALVALMAAQAATAAAPPLVPIDPQNWTDPSVMTWADYTPAPGPDWSDPSLVPTIKKWKAAIVLVDYDDMPFTITKPQGSDHFGNPQATGHDIPRDQVPAFWQAYLNVPSAANHFQTMNKYWMEDTYGKYGVQLDSFGPYKMPKKSFEYHTVESITGGTGASCNLQTNVVGAQTNVTNIAVVSSAGFAVTQPINVGTSARTITAIPDSTHITVNTATSPANNALVHSCVGNIRTDALAAWRAGTGNPTVNTLYDNVFYVGAGQDESGTWQEFGPMMWLNREDVTDEFGPPNPLLPNWMITRFAPWSSWAVGETLWPNASGNTSVEAESSGMGTFAHEFTHNLGIGDNYNNPYGNPPQRAGTGYWDMMSRGSFNGPGGTHTRYLIPGQNGSALGSDHNIRNKLKLGFLTNSNVVRLNRSGLATTGLVTATIKVRAADPGPTGLSGVTIVLDGAAPVDKDPACNSNVDFTCATPSFTGYSIEGVQRIGNDSFTTGHGVLISKTKTSESSSCGTFTCFVWIIDAHPENINLVDFYRPDGTPEFISMAHPRQLDDATFNAGTNSGSQYEYEDTPNRLHFYVIDKKTAADGVLSYTVGVKSLDGAGPQTRGVQVENAPAQPSLLPLSTTCTFPLTNSGVAAATSPTAHPQGDVTQFVNSDVYRLSVDSNGAGWHAQLWNALATAGFGETVSVPVYVTRDAGSAPNTSVALTATSVSDTTKTSTATCAVAAAKPTVTFTLNPATPSGSNGWYTGDVTVSWQVADANSTVDCGDFTFTTDGAAVSRTCSATNDGGTTSVTATVKRDTVGPVTSEGVSPAAPNGKNGWYVTNPTVSLSATDATSGVASSRYYIGENGAWTPYTGPFLFCSAANPCGRHWFHGDSTDFAGNTGAVSSITLSVDLNDPTSSASISPAAQNGWYATPTVTLTGDDGANGSGIDHLDYSRDGGPWTLYTGPLTGFKTGNHFVQFRATDVAGRVQGTPGLIAFKADSDAPSVTITRPAEGESFPLDKVVTAAFKCAAEPATQSGIASCTGTVANGANLNTSTVGPHTFTVTATDKAGNQTVVTRHYQVSYTWNGFFAPVSNTETKTLNLVHAGDLIKLGFGLNGNRGLNVLAYPPPDRSSLVDCPTDWTLKSVPAGGAGTTPGLSYGVASGHYTYGWQTSAGWAGTCRRFKLETNDGSGVVHTADFMFFA